MTWKIILRDFLGAVLHPQDMTEAAMQLMQEHVAYWKDLADRGIAVVFGPVSDPNGAWGRGNCGSQNKPEVRTPSENDPTVKSGLKFKYEIYPMPQAFLRKSCGGLI